jgi:hypothetical protein
MMLIPLSSELVMTEFASTHLASTPLPMQNELTYNFAQLVCPKHPHPGVRDYYLSICDALERCHFVK